MLDTFADCSNTEQQNLLKCAQKQTSNSAIAERPRCRWIS